MIAKSALRIARIHLTVALSKAAAAPVADYFDVCAADAALARAGSLAEVARDHLDAARTAALAPSSRRIARSPRAVRGGQPIDGRAQRLQGVTMGTSSTIHAHDLT